MMVWVLADKPAKDCCELLVGRLEYSKEIVIGGVSLEECAFYWNDVSPLLPGTD